MAVRPQRVRRQALPLENRNVNRVPPFSPIRSLGRLRPVPVAALALSIALAGCSWFGGGTSSGDSADYRTVARQAPELDVPPDLTQLARDTRYQPRGGVVSASELAAQGAPAVAAPSTATAGTPAGTPTAPNAVGEVRLVREGQARWLVTSLAAEQVWPIAEAFWRDLGFSLAVDNAQTGILETSWAENRALLPDDTIRRWLGNALGSLFSTGVRDSYRMRVERGTQGTEIFIAHRGAEEVVHGDRRDLTIWQPRPSDPLLEADMLSRLMLRLGGKPEAAAAVKAGVAAAAQPAPTRPAGELVLPDKAEMEIAEGFDRAWRQVGLALDRSGFTIEDRDRSAGLYFVRYVDPRQAGKDEPSFFAKLFSGSTADPAAPQRYRVAVKAAGSKTAVSVQDGKGAADNSENARRIVARLQESLRR